MIKRLMSVAAGSLLLLTGAANGDVDWTWSFAGESGTFTTDGDPGPGTFTVLDFSVESSDVGGDIGSVGGGQYTMSGFSTNPPYQIVFDGNVVTAWLHSGGNTFDWNVYAQVSNPQRFYFFGWDSGNVNDPTKGAYYDSGLGRELTVGTLTVEQNVGGYRLRVSGTCPGRVTVEWSGGTPNNQQGLVFGANQGNTVIPTNQPCSGTVLGVSGQVRLVDPPGLFGNQGGAGSISGSAGTAACNGYLQLVEGGTCQTSNVAQLP